MLKLVEFLRCDLELNQFLSFFWIVNFHYMISFQSSLLDGIRRYDAMTTSAHIRPHQKKRGAKYRWHMHVGGNSHSSS
jgi:hypothetical protein